MSKRISAGGKPINAKRRIEHSTSTAMPVSKPKVNKIPCSLCHQVVEELKYHYDICEPCHQKEQEESDMDEEPSESLDLSNDDLDYDEDSDASTENEDDITIDESCTVLRRENAQDEKSPREQ